MRVSTTRAQHIREIYSTQKTFSNNAECSLSLEQIFLSPIQKLLAVLEESISLWLGDLYPMKQARKNLTPQIIINNRGAGKIISRSWICQTSILLITQKKLRRHSEHFLEQFFHTLTCLLD